MEAKSRKEALEFEAFPGRSDIQISKALTTPSGDTIRAVVTTGGKTVLTGVGNPSRDVVILEEDYDFDSGDGGGTVVYASIWDVIIPIAEGLADKIKGGGGGGGKTCTSTTTIEGDAKSGKTTVTMTMVCK